MVAVDILHTYVIGISSLKLIILLRDTLAAAMTFSAFKSKMGGFLGARRHIEF